ncbi:MAG TPA: lysozyme inhibitor LprI family protein [Acidobacteriaceae bacterium]|nr:lysozyme inhibitor LprI family protein [Acidobacteriaceae bacterium]
MRRMISSLILISFCGLPLVCLAQKDSPCPAEIGPTVSNAEIRECYTKAQIAMNKRADELVLRAAASLHESPKDKAIDGPVIVQLLENAVQKLNESQVTWRSYRDQYCDAVSFSYTTGSGSGTAMEECLYKTALLRVRQLRLDFPDSAAAKGHLH